MSINIRYSNRENKLQSLPCFEKGLVGCLTHCTFLVNLRNRTAKERRRQTVCEKRDNNYI